MSNNYYRTLDTMYHETKCIKDNKDIVILSGDKDSSIVILNKNDYSRKIGIQQQKYKETNDKILKELE